MIAVPNPVARYDRVVKELCPLARLVEIGPSWLKHQVGPNKFQLTVLPKRIFLPSGADPTFTSQPQAGAGRDTYLNSTAPTFNYGVVNQFILYNGINRVSLIGFDLVSIPNTATCDSATLDLWTGASFSASTELLYIMVTKDWVEGSGSGTAQVGSSCHGSKLYDPSTPTYWAGGGAFTASDYGSQLASMSVSAAAAGEKKTFTLDTTVMATAFGDANFSLVARHTGFNTSTYRSSDTTTTGEEPKLTIVYTLAGPPLQAILVS